MNAIAITLFLGLLQMTQCLAGESAIQLKFVFRDVPREWLAFIADDELERLTSDEGVIPFPATVSRLNTHVEASTSQEFVFADPSPEDQPIPYGIFISLTPSEDNHKLFLAGTVVIKRLVPSEAKDVRVSFATQEIVIRTEFKNAEAIELPLQSGGILLITPNLLDATGKPLNQNKENKSEMATPRKPSD